MEMKMLRSLTIFLSIISMDTCWAFLQSSANLVSSSIDTTTRFVTTTTAPLEYYPAVNNNATTGLLLFPITTTTSTTTDSVLIQKKTSILVRRPPSPKERKHGPHALRAESWNGKFDQLVAFQKKYGHVNVPQTTTTTPTNKDVVIPPETNHQYHEYPQLATFCRNMRHQYRLLHQEENRHLSFLTHDRIQRLEDIGFVWSSHEAAWSCKYEELDEFRQTHGHCNVPSNTLEWRDLRNWVGYQRLRYKKGVTNDNKKYKALTLDQIALLESIDFRWSPKDEIWWENFANLKGFKEQHGHYKVHRPLKLRRWKDYLRRICREYALAVSIEGTTEDVHVSGLNEERLEALRSINYCWLPIGNGPLKEAPPEDIFAGYH
jgi:hypothetical protein